MVIQFVKMVLSTKLMAICFYFLDRCKAMSRTPPYITKMRTVPSEVDGVVQVETSAPRFVISTSSTTTKYCNKEGTRHVVRGPNVLIAGCRNEEDAKFSSGSRTPSGLITTTTVLARSNMFEQGGGFSEPVEGRKCFLMLFKNGFQSRCSAKSVSTNNTGENTGRLIPLDTAKRNSSRSTKRLPKKVGPKLRLTFKKFGRSIRRKIAPSTETIGHGGSS